MTTNNRDDWDYQEEMAHEYDTNQCDGCKRGLPLKDGIHYNPEKRWDKIACTAYKYKRRYIL